MTLPDYTGGVFFTEGNRMDFKTIQEIAEEWDISEKRVQVLCQEGRIEGAVRFGRIWAIPAHAQKPEDRRIHSGRYINWRGRNEEVACKE